MIHYITGGERSGKSSYAQSLAENLSNSPYYLATSRIWDKDFEKRVERHKNDRDERWTTIEEETKISTVIPENSVIVIDCVTLWLTNLYIDFDNNVEKALEFANNEIENLSKLNSEIIIISNEIGMGVHAQTHIARKFTELQGWTNQRIAKKADKAIFMVSGMPLILK
ncbi:adenosylcobinamide kinase /adenosylcobinamide-phosphate guanylyltransferase [Lutibacter oricola]|uniref:Adenosylcobinamide kinase n=1 Tax=Lutibacter oricola TaxID=762486 RepID=A0A1H2X7Z1_9FLAO|nr:bifunctional adenosylcobinamide kinase/adenosylcobinamide-phosphate guanylyltransferase [Lutibacter oricola]SDW88379.1 adenosylcobinamide kinase /adenosylcobinamide-phosphate guanylyltransferase [Lutibacter oricola]